MKHSFNIDVPSVDEIHLPVYDQTIQFTCMYSCDVRWSKNQWGLA
jgi:hypothetical protein